MWHNIYLMAYRKHENDNRKVYVAMSGGVDSSVAAALLKERGFRVVGVFMKPWQPKGLTCQWHQDRQDAMRVAAALDIPLHTWDFSREYGRAIAEPLVDGYRSGVTPNPDVECNRQIKFGLFFDRAIQEGADFIATGHYACIKCSGGRLWISASKDTEKDQTYFLWGVRNQCLERTLFPVGEFTKRQVRDIARHKGISVADKKDSQGVCFVGPIPFRDFLKQRIAIRSGSIQDLHGRLLGTHDGAAYYTIGQRHGLGLTTGDGPYYVIRKNIRKNLLIVGDEKALYGTNLRYIPPEPS